MFDFYGLPKDVPTMTKINNVNNLYEKVAVLETAMRDEKDHIKYICSIYTVV